MYASIKFDKEAHFQSRGRNGYLNTHGVAVYNMGVGDTEEVHLHPITSRGEASDACRIVIRKSAIPDLIKALIDAVGPPPGEIADNSDDKRYRPSPTSISTASGNSCPPGQHS